MGNRARIPLGGAAFLSVTLSITGCIPLPLSLAMNGVFYVSSGKTVSDHLISGLAQKDCSFSRALINQTDICENSEDLILITEELGQVQNIEIEPASGYEEE